MPPLRSVWHSTVQAGYAEVSKVAQPPLGALRALRALEAVAEAVAAPPADALALPPEGPPLPPEEPPLPGEDPPTAKMAISAFEGPAL